jgi:glyoxylase-like metal-dependent hydrolase (beta-lactamase superfamily II)
MSNERDTNGKNKVQPVKFGHSNIYFIKTETGHILVDAGMPNKGDELDEKFASAGVDPASVGLIILTHGHLDHVGSVAHAQRVTGAQVLCHRSFSDSLVNGKAEPAIAQNFLGRVLNIMTGLMGNKFEGTQPDILIDDEYDLDVHGISGKVIHTPGHSPSSVSIMLDDGDALIGDLVRETGSGEISLGMFYADKMVLLESLEKVAALEPNTIYMSHGTYTDSKTLKDFIAITG